MIFKLDSMMYNTNQTDSRWVQTPHISRWLPSLDYKCASPEVSLVLPIHQWSVTQDCTCGQDLHREKEEIVVEISTWRTHVQMNRHPVFTVVHTFILVCVQKVLELGVEDLQVLLDENLLTFPGQLILCALVKVNLHSPLLLQQTCLSLQNTRIDTSTSKTRKLNNTDVLWC